MKWMLKTPRGKDLREGLELAKEAGYDGAEIQIYDAPGGEAWEKLVRNEAERLGLLISVHAPSGDINLSSSNSGIRRESLSQVLDTIRSAAAVGAMSVTVHPGRLSSMRETSAWTKVIPNFFASGCKTGSSAAHPAHASPLTSTQQSPLCTAAL